MNSSTIAADLILIIHLAFIAFIILGQAGIIIGYFQGWRWVRSRTFRLAHLAAIGIVVIQAWTNLWCPLTVWENALRRAGGGPGYSESFIQHWVSRLIYWDLPLWVFTIVYTLFAGLVAISWLKVRPR